MTTFYICRHGETENNKKHRLQGWIDTPLTETGVRHAMSSAAKLGGIKFDAVVSSDLGRAFTSAYIIAKEIGYNGIIERSPGLREVNYGDHANMPYEMFPELTVAEMTNFKPPNGESLSDMKERVLSTISQLAGKYNDKTILVVGHDGTINSIRASLTGETAGQADTIHNPHDFVARFTVDNGKIVSFDEHKG